MYGTLTFKKRYLIIFLLIISIVVPVYSTTPASANQMISDIYEQDRENDQDQPVLEEQEEKEVVTGQGLNLWDYLKMLFALIFVIALLLFVLKFINKKSFNNQSNSIVRNIGGVNLGAQKSVQLLQIGNSIYVVGVGEDVQLIREIDNPEEIEQLIQNFNEKQTLTVTSPYLLEQVKKLRTKLRKNEEDDNHTQKSFGEIFNNKLADIKKARQNDLEKWKEKERDK